MSKTLRKSGYNLTIGTGDESNPCFFEGNIDDIRIYNRELSEAEIKLLYIESPDAVCDENTNHCYKRYDDTISWHVAKAHCESEGGYLVTITSQDEQDFVFDELVSFSPNNCWIGATDEAEEGKWQWFNEEKWKYDNWSTGQPDNCDDLEHYGAISNTDGTWQDKMSLNNGSGTCDCPVNFEPMSTICEWGDILGDLNADNKVDEGDYEEFRKVFGKCKGDSGYIDKADYDEDGCVSFRDFRIWYIDYYLD